MLKMMESLIANLLGTDGPAQDVPASGNGPARAMNPANSAIPRADDNVVDALRRILGRRDPSQAGSIQLMGLESLRARMGDRWPAVADRVHLLTIRLLNQYLSPLDTWFRPDGETYVVVFAQLGPAQAGEICSHLVEELQALLWGTAETGSIKARAVVHAIGSETMFDPAKLRRTLDAARTGAAGTGTATDGFTGSQGEAAGPLEVRYRPIWDVKQQVLSVFTVRPCRQRRGGSLLWGLDCLDDPEDPAQILELDLFVLREAVSVALELFDNRFRFFLSVPIHFESLAVQSRRRALIGCLQAIPPHMRSLMTYHLRGAPAGVPVSRLAEMISTLRPYGRTTMVVVDPVSADLSVVAAAGAKVACLLLPPGASVQRHRAELLRFGLAAQKHRLHTSVEGVEDFAMEALCEEAQISFLSGDLIGGWVEVPQQAVRRSLDDFRAMAPAAIPA
ncbi:hypothetical protein [Niveispirillum fermenti]|uniref:hypothetical protein n=1 Tax=Niveispirillum fermenti TaxID=1233113 RepID=UPI003A84AEA7